MDISYNTARPSIKFKEYGRGIQDLVNHLKTIEDPARRQACAEEIVEAMALITPTPKNPEEHERTLWSHLMAMAGNDLDIEVPVEMITYNDQLHPEKLDYPRYNSRYKHYGSLVQHMIEKAIAIEDPEERKEYTEYIAAYMKMSYISWNNDSVTDAIIRKDLKELSAGKLAIDEYADLDYLYNTSKKSKQQIGNFVPLEAILPKRNKKKKKKKKKKAPGSSGY